MISLFPLDALARAVVNRFLDLCVICFGDFSSVHVGATVVRFSEIVAVEPEIAGVCICTKATARAIIFNYVNDAAHAVNLCN